MTDLSPASPASAQGEDAAPPATRHLGWALVLISVAQLMVVLDATIANIALPYIGADLDIAEANLSWIVTGYALAFGGLLLLGGRLGDLLGRRRVLMAGLVIFAVASLLGGLATNEGLLLGARGLQGLGAALASPAALALITTTFPAGPARNRAFAIYAAMSGIGAAFGLILGGWLTGHSSFFGVDVEGWRMTFLINVPIGIVAALLAPRFLPESARHAGRLDVPGAATGTLGLLGIVFGLTRASEEAHGWGDTGTIASLVAGVVLLAAFIVIETRVSDPLMPIRIFANRTRAASFVAMMMVPAAMFAMFFFLSLYVQNLGGWEPLETGFAFLPFSIGIIVGATLSSNLVNRIDPRFIAGTGTVLAAIALFGFSRLPSDLAAGDVVASLASGGSAVDIDYVSSMLPYLLLMSFGMGLTFVPLTLTAVHHVRAEDSGIGSGVLNTMQQVGGALGLAALATVASHVATNSAETFGPQAGQAVAGAGVPAEQGASLAQGATQLAAFADGSTTAFLVGTGLVLIGSVVVWLFVDVKHEELATDAPEGVHVG
ncbi:EmrB/QacA subfamily drug resistance transporter [Nocardioides zeae]|uniref:EmrB/QacA subfamily drug resistance transporter n=1 Tax=Nocardioides zeae TaxID=1457234 RepID=A0ACC6IKW8_9ACTN|nr:MFS transporter [Nocardioides zeae]MDR6211288.1 EmrB/QacA subfamily drug resistance transporter [Nocardioides zeae]